MNQSHLFDPEKSLIQLKILWWSVGIPLFISTIIFIIIVCNSNLIFQGNYGGFNHFLLIFKVPLTILALIIPIVALLAANHRSEQTKKQIILSRSQNNFTNYYNHLGEFNLYVKEHFEGLPHKPDSRQLHRKLFPYAFTGDSYSACEKLILELDKLIFEIVNDSVDIVIDYKEEIDFGVYANKQYAAMNEILYSYNLPNYRNIDDDDKVKLSDTQRRSLASGNLPLEFISHIRLYLVDIITLCSFDTTFEKSNNIELFLSINKDIIFGKNIEFNFVKQCQDHLNTIKEQLTS